MPKSKSDSSSLSSLHESLEGRVAADPELVREFEQTIALHRNRVFAVCNRIVRNEQLAEEITNEALLIAYRKLAGYERRASLSTWLCGIAKMVAMNAVRKKGELLSEDGVLEREDPSRDALRRLSADERKRVLLEALADLPRDEQDVVYMRYIENLPHESIEGLLALPETTSARVVLQRAKNRLKRNLTARLEELNVSLSFVRTRE